MRQAFDWLDARTGFRAIRRHLLDEPLPSGTGWWFVTGSIVLFLLAVQMATGVVLTMYYVPSPEFAHDSVRFITEQLAFGSFVRGLHYFGASFVVVAAVVHMLRVVVFASYKKPRELTWITGVVSLLLILAFALTGYLLPWDQKAYWATTVTINVARSGPFGEQVAALLRGGEMIGALTLLRWYSAHVFLLPAALVGFTVAHLYLMRRHGISGPMVPREGPPRPFYPYHALKDTLACAAVFSALVALAATLAAPLEPVADPTDASYIPRPEWYFLSLFQLLKYFPGPLEPVATIVIPGLVVLLLFALPFLDRRPERHPFQRPAVTGAFGVLVAGMGVLTLLGLRDTPREPQTEWSPLAIAGREIANDKRCVSCHRAGGVATILDETRMRKEPTWVLSHVRDPEVIAPGLRPPPNGAMSEAEAQSVLRFMQEITAGGKPPSIPHEERTALVALGRYCVMCHTIDGEGSAAAPDLSTIGAARDAEYLRQWIADPTSVDPFATMPPFADTLTAEELDAVASYLAARR